MSIKRLTLGVLALIAAPAAMAQDTSSTTPRTQTASNGSYWVMEEGADGASSRYNAVENLCITTNGRRFFGVKMTGDGEPTVAETEDGPIPIVIGAVDGSAGKRHYKISNPRNAEEFLTMNFIAPGMREADQPSATAGLSSISSGEDYNIECVESDQLVMIAVAGEGAVAVSLIDGELVLQVINRDTQNARRIGSGLFFQDEKGSVFHFFDDDRRVRIELSSQGSPDSGNILLESPINLENSVVRAYFLANPAMIADRAPGVSGEASSLLNRLSSCNHFAGEASEDAERNAQIMKKWEELQCDAVPALRRDVLADAEAGSPIHTYLTKTTPNWE